MNIFQNWISWESGEGKREREENPKLFCIIRAIKQFIQTAGDAINIAWWLAPLIFHLILYICFYDLPANRNTQRESRWVGNGWLRDKAERVREREGERGREKGQRAPQTSFPHLPQLRLRHVIRIICNFGFLLVFPFPFYAFLIKSVWVFHG